MVDLTAFSVIIKG